MEYGSTNKGPSKDVPTIDGISWLKKLKELSKYEDGVLLRVLKSGKKRFSESTF